MDEIRQGILREQELAKARLSAGLGEAFSVQQSNQRGKGTQASVEKAEDPEFQKAYEELFGTDDIEKAVYADTAENRKLGRVGQEWGGKKKKQSATSSRKELTKKRDSLVAEYTQLRKKKMSGQELTSEEREKYGKLEKEIDSIGAQLTRKNPTKKRDIEKRLFALKNIGRDNMTEEEKKEYAELNDRLLSKKMENNKSSEDYPSRQEEKEIRSLMEEDGIDPDEAGEKTWKKYYKQVKQSNQRGKGTQA